ncbi:hypothetical protein BMF94_5053 [Rhodotorula taiwanensis]|uniref:F-box domain-containing protein n=1 Tax=Rhodotorula taiwanensis TaxID=741276 RepID=A0A2S5B569_9BASI|nr:hypothetical protein BMF94_5053 [Rhodotorula taiwanensis]
MAFLFELASGVRAELASGVRALFSRRPASLLDMPDDVLERIGHYLAVLDTKRTNCGTPRLKYHYVNRRLYRIFRPRWFRHLDLAFDKQGDERNLIEKLLWAADIRRFVTSAKVTLSKEEAEVEAIALGVLVHLEQLEIAMEPNGWNHRGWIPNAAHDAALASLAGRFPGLRVLTCGQYTTTDDDSILELKRSPLPQSLSTFGIRIYDSSLLSTALPDVRVISMVAVLSKMNPPQVSLPWYTLQTLSVGLSLSLAYNRWLAETLEIATRDGTETIPLRHLKVWATPYEQTAKAYLPDLGSIESILRLLTMSDLKTLQLKFGIAATAAMEHIALSALQSLDLRFECDVLGENCFLDLVGGLVKAAPHLVRLVVDATDLFCPTAEHALARLRLSAWNLARQHPQVRALSLLAAESQIIDFRTWRIRGSVDAWVRWTRRSPLDAFAVDVWYFYEAPEDV